MYQNLLIYTPGHELMKSIIIFQHNFWAVFVFLKYVKHKNKLKLSKLIHWRYYPFMLLCDKFVTFCQIFDFIIRRDHKKKFLWASRLWVGRPKEPILGYVPKNDEKKIQAVKCNKNMNLILVLKMAIFSNIFWGTNTLIPLFSNEFNKVSTATPNVRRKMSSFVMNYFVTESHSSLWEGKADIPLYRLYH